MNKKVYLLLISVVFALLSQYYSQTANDQQTYQQYPLQQNIVNCAIALSQNLSVDCPIINGYDYTVVLDSSAKCRSKKPIELMVLVKSAVENSANRNIIRASWGKDDYYGESTARTVFMLARPNSEAMMKQIIDEHSKYRDIVMFNFLDTYRNLTYKTMMIHKWAVTHCTNSKYYLISDDNMFQNIKNYLNLTRSKKTTFCNINTETVYAGNIMNSGPIRESQNKWYVKLDEYHYISYPPYISGCSTIYSIKTMKLFYYASFFTKHFWIDDVYTGLLAHKVGIDPIKCDKMLLDGNKLLSQPEVINDILAALLSSSREQMIQLWKYILY